MDKIDIETLSRLISVPGLLPDRKTGSQRYREQPTWLSPTGSDTSRGRKSAVIRRIKGTTVWNYVRVKTRANNKEKSKQVTINRAGANIANNVSVCKEFCGMETRMLAITGKRHGFVQKNESLIRQIGRALSFFRYPGLPRGNTAWLFRE